MPALRPPPRPALRAVLVFLLAVPALGAYGYGSGKKSKFLEAYPMIFKFFLFWWCVIVFIVMGVYILDFLMSKRYGSAKVEFVVEHKFKPGIAGGRKALWEQLADPTKWSPRHPVIASADLRMVRCTAAEESANGDGKTEPPKPQPNAALGDEATPSTRLEPVELRPLQEGLGFILRHKSDDPGPRAGTFYCTRECTKLEQPSEGLWRLGMRTVEVGNGYQFDADSEESEVQLHPPAKDGSMLCVVCGTARCRSRLFRWWNQLQANSRVGAEAMLQAIEDELLASKKND
mmetsp:Transcript_93397/g.268943  ORF Transcript_93397/g.268943 Transcript_93397/m.268943 type:complete len:289 (-) Transcript_93397:77-943(-)